jgi:hypothetical protein
MLDTGSITKNTLVTGFIIVANAAMPNPIPEFITPKAYAMGYYSSNSSFGSNWASAPVSPAFNRITRPAILHDPFAQFIIPDREELDRYLATNPDILPMLPGAPSSIKKFFPQSSLTMGVSIDPEIENYEHLTISIQTNLDPEQALPKLYELWEKWLFTDMAAIKDKMIVDVEYV